MLNLTTGVAHETRQTREKWASTSQSPEGYDGEEETPAAVEGHRAVKKKPRCRPRGHSELQSCQTGAWMVYSTHVSGNAH